MRLYLKNNKYVFMFIKGLADIILALLSLEISFLFCYSHFIVSDSDIKGKPVVIVLTLYTIIIVISYIIFGLYRIVYDLISLYDILKAIICVLFITACLYFSSFILSVGFSLKFFIVFFIIHCILLLISRYYHRLFYNIKLYISDKPLNNKVSKKILLIGAGEAGKMIINELGKDKESKIVCIIDDQPSKIGCRINSIPIVGDRNFILKAADRFHVNEIILAIPSLTDIQKHEILSICKNTGCKVRIFPGIKTLYNGEKKVEVVRDINIEDLLFRSPIKINNDSFFNHLNDKVVLVTGGGGSIGSELCRQIAQHTPKLLIIFDIYENNAYDVQQELIDQYSFTNLVVLIGSVRDVKRLNYIFKTYKPNIVFHAAAHKHVPLMEDSPLEAIKNNVIGTFNTAFIAMVYGCERFVLISTDKAVNPTNIMGATKRLCEMIIQMFNQISKDKSYLLTEIEKFSVFSDLDLRKEDINTKTEYVAVRFGNVLGSNGSVLPLFKKQIQNGGPVKVTHPDIIRYFMTIPEAVSLIIAAESNAEGGEIFVLDMGSPVKIVDLARNLITLNGLRPDIDIKIEYTGLRPGEKLYEEKLMQEEGLKKTANNLIHIAKPLNIDIHELLFQLHDLFINVYSDSFNPFDEMERIVPTFKHKKRK